MIGRLKIRGARALLLLVVAGALGFGILAAAMAAVMGGVLMLALRLAGGRPAGAAEAAEGPAVAGEHAGQPASAQPA